VLLIHGVGSSFEHNWRATGWVDMLESEGRDVLAVHLPGHGPDPAFEPSDTGPGRIIAAAEGASEPIDAVGFSAGGHALLNAAAQRPELFRRIAVLGVGNPRDESTATQTGGSILAGLESDEEPTEDVPRIIRRLIDSAGNDRRAVAQFMRTPGRVLRPEDFAAISMPTLLVIGDQDFAGPADQLAAALPDAQLITLRGVDHFSTPSNFGCLDAVLRFLEA
jgi:pimeloyl-ACP methyl ester carboxylesterase